MKQQSAGKHMSRYS